MNNYKEIKLVFSEEEMTIFLKKRGYVIKKIHSWKYGEYVYNETEVEDVDIVIAYPEGKYPDQEFLAKDAWWIDYRIGMTTVFDRELHKALLNL